MMTGIRHLSLFFAFLFCFSFIAFASVPNAAVFGYKNPNVVYSAMNITVIIDGDIPQLEIIEPLNRTYRNYSGVELNYSVYDAHLRSVWYSINNGANVSIFNYYSSNSILNQTLNLSTGSYFLQLFANDSYGREVNDSVYFSVNNSRIIIIYEKFRGKWKTTDFDAISEEALGNLEHVIIGNNYGRQELIHPVNLTACAVNRIIDLDSGIDIAYNNYSFSSSTLNCLNVTNEIFFYNTSFSKPRVLFFNRLCPETICTITGNADGVVSFLVANLGRFSVEESPSTSVSSPSGDPVSPMIDDFVLDKYSKKIEAFPGEKINFSIGIKNMLSSPLTVNVDFSNMPLFSGGETVVELAANEKKYVDVTVHVSSDTEPKTYLGEILFSSQNTRKFFDLSIVVKNKTSFFDTNLTIINNNLSRDEKIQADVAVKIINFFRSIDTNIEYSIEDLKGKVYYTEKEKRIISRTARFRKEFKVTEDMGEGVYFLRMKVKHGSNFDETGDFFEVKTSSFEENFPEAFRKLPLFRILVIILIVFTMIVIVLLLRYYKRMRALYAVKEFGDTDQY